MNFTYEQLIWIPILVAVIAAGGLWLFVDYFFRWRPYDDE
jgi:hypothetical protein